ncbi:MAG: heparin lyase I family protein [Polyangiaceae bacterium]|nr:heparin lyase I family protein [Polyangiaceae bacterium]
MSCVAIAPVVACEPTVVVGTWPCAQAELNDDDAGSTAPVAFPWSTSFERGFCDYEPPGGYCYLEAAASYGLTTSPVHSGNYAAAFTVSSDPNSPGPQVRCVRQGILPESAYYGAWYYIPEDRDNKSAWNLFHFTGGPGPGAKLPALWDLSLAHDSARGLHLMVQGYLEGSAGIYDTNGGGLPIGAWVHLQVYLKRAADETGALAVYQDGEEALRLTGIVTDDSEWGQWYVGNWATDIEPPESTVYVDDIAITETP